MKSIYMAALSPVKGADGDLKKFQIFCTENYGYHSPLPLMVPLFLFSSSFPRDRVNTTGLKSLPALELTGPVCENDLTILNLKEPELFDSRLIFREIHGKRIPVQEKNSFLNWKGLLLNPWKTEELPEEINFKYRTWQLGLYNIKYDNTANWWEELSCTCLWKVRKPG